MEVFCPRAELCPTHIPPKPSFRKAKTPNEFRFTFVWYLRSVSVNIFLHNRICSCLGNLGGARLSLSQQNSVWSLGNQALHFHLLCRNESNSFSALAFVFGQGTFQRAALLHPLLSKIRHARKIGCWKNPILYALASPWEATLQLEGSAGTKHWDQVT